MVQDAHAFAAIYEGHKEERGKEGGELITLNHADDDHDGAPSTWKELVEAANGHLLSVTPEAYRTFVKGKGMCVTYE